MTYCGIDVSATTLDTASASGATWQHPNTPAGIAAVVATLAPLAPTLIVLCGGSAYGRVGQTTP